MNGSAIILPARTSQMNGSMNLSPIIAKPCIPDFSLARMPAMPIVSEPGSHITNKFPIIQYYGVNYGPEGTDEYYKGGNMIHTIRQVIHNDELFRRMMRGLNQNFYHQTVTALDIQQYINKISGIDFTPVFNQYLRPYTFLFWNISSKTKT